MTVEEPKQTEHKSRGRKKAAGPTRHARIMRGIVTPIFGLLAVACIFLGVLNATTWKPSSQITAQAQVSGTRYIITDPGVLPLVDHRVTLTVEGGANSSDGTCIALGSSKDANGWLAGHAYTRVTGMNDWKTLATSRNNPRGTKAESLDDVAFKNSDMWTKVTCGASKATVTTTVSENASTVAIIDLGGTSKATVRLHWVRHKLPDFAMPFYFAGGLLAVLAVFSASVFAMPPHKRRKRVVSSTAQRETEEVTISEALTGSMASLKSAVSYRPKSKRRRHAAHRAGGTGSANAERLERMSRNESATSEEPIVVDPAARNLVADQQSGQSSSHTAPSEQSQSTSDAAQSSAQEPAAYDDSVTSVISMSELEAYFARLSQEVDEENAQSAADGDDQHDEHDSKPGEGR
ncbi:hypothetical protein [Bifidobacterium goeldii]|nr:hypothetical protein [Bifidobacterium goeldii]